MNELSREQKSQVLKDIILKLHGGGLSPYAAKERFEKEVGKISSSEIAVLEQSLIDEGLSPDEIKKFCNVHALIFQSTLEEAVIKETSPAHPVFLFKLENREIEKLINKIKDVVARQKELGFAVVNKSVEEILLKLREVDTHYARKEQILFPFLEKKQFTGPSKVMWGKDDEIRDLIKAALKEIENVKNEAEQQSYEEKKLNPLLEEVTGMIFKEENILFPIALEKLDPGDWAEILRETDNIGYVFIKQPEETTELIKHLEASMLEETVVQDNTLQMPSGALGLEEITAIFNTLPVDLTFVDKDDTVRYFSAGTKRIFLRTKAILGRKVQNCHPPQSVDVVEKILTSFKQGKKNNYDFWINFRGQLIYIRYFAIRDSRGDYLGTLEVTQDITGIKKLEGERRLLDERD